jgi:hypothetical protein
MTIDLKAVRDRLMELGHFNFVADWVSAADAIENAPPHPPAAFVTTSAERAQPNKLIGRHRQRVAQTVSVLFVIAAQRADSEQSDAVEELRLAVRDSLMGWRPPGAEAAFQYVAFSIRYSSGGLIWCEALFVAPYFATGTA